ncbi:MAG: OmpA family protein, partial [Deltaproteobacteria bacterium]|nr:OmpA family protein [Deltaproteobacteria bacterium]
AAQAGAELVTAIAPVEGTSVFFETGKASLSPEGRVKLLRIAEVLRRYPDLNVRVEGIADERGTATYNLELGARRAQAAKQYLISLQVRPEQVLLTSHGADRPLAPGHNEDSWQVNRRTDVNLVQEKGAETAPETSVTPAQAAPEDKK